MKGLYPGRGNNKIKLLQTIRRENLDACWVREPRTVEATRRNSKKIVDISQILDISVTLPEIGSFPLHDTQGMSFAICILIRSLDKDRDQSTLQYESVRNLPSDYSNLWHASKHTLTTSVMTQYIRKIHATSCASYSLWYAHAQTNGEVIKKTRQRL